MERKYIFPSNYDRKEKILGIIDYKTAIILGVIGVLLFYILKNILVPLRVKAWIFIILFGIPAVFLLVGSGGESMLELSGHIFKFLIRPKGYVYKRGKMGEKGKGHKGMVSDFLNKRWFSKG